MVHFSANRNTNPIPENRSLVCVLVCLYGPYICVFGVYIIIHMNSIGILRYWLRKMRRIKVHYMPIMLSSYLQYNGESYMYTIYIYICMCG